MCIRNEARDYTPESIITSIVVPFIKKVGGAGFGTILDMVKDTLWNDPDYRERFAADNELICGKNHVARMSKILQNTSNHGGLELNHNIVTLASREANRLGYKTPSGLKFKETWYMTRKFADRHGYPVHDTTEWDK
jgi:hypothetical protein